MGLALLAFRETSKYVLLWLVWDFEDTVAMMTGGLLVRLNSVDFWVIYPLLLSADIISDITWYAIGHFGGRPFVLRWGYLFGLSETIVEKLEHRFHKYHTSILIASKLTMGFGLATGILFTAGMLRISFTRFVVINVLGSLVWVLCMMGVGYYFGNVLALVPTRYQVLGAIVAIACAFFILREVTQRLSRVDW